MNKKALIWTIVSLVLINIALAGCPLDLSIELNPSTFTENYVNNKIQLKIIPAGMPGNVWEEYDNATLALPAELTNQTNLFKDLTNPAAQPTEVWNIKPTDLGTFQFNITVVNSSGDSCVMYKNVTVNPNVQPDLNVSVENWTDIIVDQATNFTSTINNTGNGTAYDVVKQFTGDVATQNVQIGNITNNTLDTDVDSLTVSTCGLKTITVSAKNYHNGNGLPMATISSSDSFNVFGADLKTLSLDPSDLTPNSGDTITLNATIKNLADDAYSYNSTGINTIEFYYNNSEGVTTLIESVTLNNSLLFMNGTQDVSVDWTVPEAGGNYTVYTLLESEHECDTTNNIKLASISAQGCIESWSCGSWSQGNCGTRTCTDANSCGTTVNKPSIELVCSSGGSGSGGGTGFVKPQTINFGLSHKVTKQMTKLAKVNFMINDAAHSVELSAISKDEVELIIRSEPMTVKLEIGDITKVDFEEDGIYDLMIKLEDIINYKAKITFEKIEELYLQQVTEEFIEEIEEQEKTIDNESEETDEVEEKVEPLTEPDKKEKVIKKDYTMYLLVAGMILLLLILVFRNTLLRMFFEPVDNGKKKNPSDNKGKNNNSKKKHPSDKLKKKSKKPLLKRIKDFFFEEIDSKD